MGDFPYTIEKIGEDRGSITYSVQPIGYSVSTGFKDILPRVYSLPIRPDDVWLLGLPKSGTTWASELIWTVYNEGNVKEAREKKHFKRWCVPENDAYHYKTKKMDKIPDSIAFLREDSVDHTTQASSPRFIRCHLPLSLLPPNLLDTCKVVYIVRDFKDCLVSLQYMLAGGNSPYPNAFEDGVKRFMTDRMFLYPWTSVLKESWAQRNHRNMMFIFYEDMIKDITKVIKEMADFLGKTLTEKQVEDIKEHLSFQSMKGNDSINLSELWKLGVMADGSSFIRKGIVGDWKNHFTPELKEQYDSWWRKNMEGCDFKFPQE